MKRIAIIGAGPAGLMAAEAALEADAAVTIYDAMPSAARKLLMAGKSGLNITHSEEQVAFESRYPDADQRLLDMLGEFGPSELTVWMDGLGTRTFTGSSGRVFPEEMKASPLLRRWLGRLNSAGTDLMLRHRWQGWGEDGALCFSTPEGDVRVEVDATILALGGASWSRLGSDGGWTEILAKKGVAIEPFAPSNCGFAVDWSGRLLEALEGEPVKGVSLSAGGDSQRGDFVITRYGIESGAVYPLSSALRKQLEARDEAELSIDLLPDIGTDMLAKRLAATKAKDSMTNRLRKGARLDVSKIALLNEVTHGQPPREPEPLAALIKALPLRLSGTAPLDAAISTAGGVSWDALDERLMLKAVPGTYCAGEMVAWDAPTGGYLLTACLAMGRAVGLAAAGAR